MGRRAERWSEYREDNLPVSEEVALTITVDNRELVTLLCTPRDLRELAVGWLYAERIVDSISDIVSIAGCAHDRELMVSTASGKAPGEGHWRLITSGCGAGAGAEVLSLDRIPRVQGGVTSSLGQLRERFADLRQGATVYRRTGGIHSAALCDGDRLVVQREDIGRHNAVDKVVGYGLLNNTEFARCALLSTGRLSSEMVWKAARAGIAVIASLSIPTDLACDIAHAAGITLVGRAVGARPRVYTHPERVALQ